MGKLCFQLLFSKVLPHWRMKKTSYANGKHAHTPSFAFSLPLPCKLVYFWNRIILRTYRTDIQRGFFPFCGNWPEHVRPSQQVWGSAELQLICTHMEDSSLHYICLKASPPIHTGSGGHPRLARCSQLLQTNRFISTSTATATAISVCLSAEFKQWLPCKNLLCLRWCRKFKSWWSPCLRSSSDYNTGKILATINYKCILAAVSPYSYFLFVLMFFQCFLQTAPATTVSVTEEYNTTVTTLGDTCVIFTVGFSARLFPCHVPIVSTCTWFLSSLGGDQLFVLCLHSIWGCHAPVLH